MLGHNIRIFEYIIPELKFRVYSLHLLIFSACLLDLMKQKKGTGCCSFFIGLFFIEPCCQMRFLYLSCNKGNYSIFPYPIINWRTDLDILHTNYLYGFVNKDQGTSLSFSFGHFVFYCVCCAFSIFLKSSLQETIL